MKKIFLLIASALHKTSQRVFFLGLAAVLLGLAAQVLLGLQETVFAVCLYILAVSLLIVAFSRQPGPAAALSTSPTENFITWPVPAIICGVLALVASVMAFFVFNSSSNAIVPWLLHLVSIALLILAAAWAGRSQIKHEAPEQPWKVVEIVILLAIIALAAFLRLYRLNELPFGTWFDEADDGLNALQILNQPGFLPVFSESTRLPAHLIYLIALSFRIFGISTMAVRLVSVAFGLAATAAAYLVGRELFDRRMGMVLAFMLAISRWDINWSRIGMHGVSVPFFELLAVGLVLRALKRQRPIDYTLAGMTIGFGLCFYVPFRLFPLVIGLFLLAVWLTHRDFFRASWRGLVMFGLGVYIAFVPVFQFAVFQPEAFWGRMEDISIFNGKSVEEGWKAVAKTTSEHLLMFNVHGDTNGRHNLMGEPMVDPISGALLVLGLGISLWRIRRPASFLLVIWLLFMIVPGIFSLEFESPQSYRSIGSLPAVFLLAAVPIHALWQEWDKWASKRFAPIFLAGLAIALSVSAAINFNIYFNRQARSFDSWIGFSAPETIIGKEMQNQDGESEYYVSTFYYGVPTIQFLAPEVSYQRLETYDSLTVQSDCTKSLTFFLDADRRAFYNLARQYYPAAEFTEHTAPDGSPALFEITLKPEDRAAVQGLTASYYAGADWSTRPLLVRKETNFSFDWQDGDPAPFPFGVEWQGVLAAPTYGNYHLVVRSPAPAEIFIDDVRVELTGKEEKTADVLLAKGNHSILIRAEAGRGKFELAWTPPHAKETVISACSLFVPPVMPNGLLGSYYPNQDWQGLPAFAQIDPYIYFYYHNQPIERPYTVEWTGSIQIANGGLYRFGLESIDESYLYIDDELVLENWTPNNYQDVGLNMEPGLHPVRIRFSDRTGNTHINFFWAPPDSDIEVVPPEVLFPPHSNPDLLRPMLNAGPDPSTASVNTDPQQTGATHFAIDVHPQVNASLLWQTGQCGSDANQFSDPHRITVDSQGNTWVADTGNYRVVKLDPQGNFESTFGKSGDRNGQFIQIYDLIVEPDGSLITLDPNGRKILQRFDSNGKFHEYFGVDLNTYYPRGLASDSAGNVYLVDTGLNRVLKMDPAGNLQQVWEEWLEHPEANQPVSAAIGPDGTIYIVDSVSGLIREISSNGALSWEAVNPSDSYSSSDIAVGPNNTIYISDPEERRVVIFNADQQPAGQLSADPDGRALFGKPVGIALGPGGILVVSDSDLCRVSAFQLPESIWKD